MIKNEDDMDVDIPDSGGASSSGVPIASEQIGEIGTKASAAATSSGSAEAKSPPAAVPKFIGAEPKPSVPIATQSVETGTAPAPVIPPTPPKFAPGSIPPQSTKRDVDASFVALMVVA
jgi:hypothetical protein